MSKIQLLADELGVPTTMLIDHYASALYKWDLAVAILAALGLWLIWRYNAAAQSRYHKLRLTGSAEELSNSKAVASWFGWLFMGQFVLTAVQVWDFITTALAPQAKAIEYLANLI